MRFGLTGFSGGCGASIMLNFSPFCSVSRLTAICASLCLARIAPY
jgi:hypothetical protein